MITAPDITRVAYFNGLRSALIQEVMQLRMGGNMARIYELVNELAAIHETVAVQESDDGW